jgi:hypothetical protein
VIFLVLGKLFKRCIPCLWVGIPLPLIYTPLKPKTANVVAMDETAIYDYSSVRICLIANIPTFLFINRWCKAKKPSLMRGRGIPTHKHGMHLLKSLPRTRKITYFLPLFCSFKCGNYEIYIRPYHKHSIRGPPFREFRLYQEKSHIFSSVQ